MLPDCLVFILAHENNGLFRIPVIWMLDLQLCGFKWMRSLTYSTNYHFRKSLSKQAHRTKGKRGEGHSKKCSMCVVCFLNLCHICYFSVSKHFSVGPYPLIASHHPNNSSPLSVPCLSPSPSASPFLSIMASARLRLCLAHSGVVITCWNLSLSRWHADSQGRVLCMTSPFNFTHAVVRRFIQPLRWSDTSFSLRLSGSVQCADMFNSWQR